MKRCDDIQTWRCRIVPIRCLFYTICRYQVVRWRARLGRRYFEVIFGIRVRGTFSGRMYDSASKYHHPTMY